MTALTRLLTLTLCMTFTNGLLDQYQKVKDVEVTLPIGTLLGETLEVQDTTVDVFQGIPYGTAPTGAARFKKTTPFGSWQPNTWNATYLRAPCMQNTVPDPFFEFERSTFSEDCLHLNIFAPSSKQSKKLTTMVWVHGGSFVAGTGGQHTYDGAMMAAMGDVIVVTINYRLGSLGFLYTGGADAPGNAGLWDIILSLEWLQTYIHHFGGNPDSVTLFGESAGGALVSLLSVAPAADNLFDKIIEQSGNALVPWAVLEPEDSLEKTRRLAEATGCDQRTSVQMVDCLRNLDIETLQEHERSSVDNYPYVFTNMPWAPTIDGDLIPAHPVTLLKEKKFKQRPMLIGDNKDEGSGFVTTLYSDGYPMEAFPIPRDQYEEYLRMFVEAHFRNNDLVYDVVLDKYWAGEDPDTNRDVLIEMLSDCVVVCGGAQKADLFAEAGSKVFKYQLLQRYSYSIYPVWVGVTHAIEIPIVFGNSWWPASRDDFSDDDRMLSEFTMKAWTSFAKTGSPTPAGTQNVLSKEWLEYDSEKKRTFLITTSDDASTHEMALKSRQCAFWNSIVPKLLEHSSALQECEKKKKTSSGSAAAVRISGIAMAVTLGLLLAMAR